MLQKLHQNAKTNYLIRQEIQSSSDSTAALARRFNLSWATVKKWQSRNTPQDYSSRPHRLRTNLTAEQIERLLNLVAKI